MMFRHPWCFLLDKSSPETWKTSLNKNLLTLKIARHEFFRRCGPAIQFVEISIYSFGSKTPSRGSRGKWRLSSGSPTKHEKKHEQSQRWLLLGRGTTQSIVRLFPFVFSTNVSKLLIGNDLHRARDFGFHTVRYTKTWMIRSIPNIENNELVENIYQIWHGWITI